MGGRFFTGRTYFPPFFLACPGFFMKVFGGTAIFLRSYFDDEHFFPWDEQGFWWSRGCLQDVEERMHLRSENILSWIFWYSNKK